MTPNELRIGNFVKLRDTGEIVRVCGLTKHRVGFHAPNERPNAQLRYRRYSEIEPVLIRDEYDSLPFIPDLLWNDKVKSGEVYHYNGLILTYLHELQNAFFVLMGIELKIEL